MREKQHSQLFAFKFVANGFTNIVIVDFFMHIKIELSVNRGEIMMKDDIKDGGDPYFYD